jgi:N-methylhydantoinase A/oxoprolinase/acetone carboxylase beta subunit
MSSEGDVVEFTEWSVNAHGRVAEIQPVDIRKSAREQGPVGTRRVYFNNRKATFDVPVYGPVSLPIDKWVEGPLLVDETLTTIVIEPGAAVRLSKYGNYVVELR